MEGVQIYIYYNNLCLLKNRNIQMMLLRINCLLSNFLHNKIIKLYFTLLELILILKVKKHYY